MKYFKTQIIGLVSIISLTCAANSLTVAQAAYADRKEIIFPVPADEDTLLSFGRPTRSQLPPKKMKFLVWNLHKGTEETFKIEYLALGMGRDIIMNQEVFLDSKMMDVFGYFPHMLFTTATSFFSGKEKTRTGVANITSVKPETTEFLRTETLEPVVNSPKVLLINSYPIRFSNKKLTVVNIHGINFVSNKSFRHEMNRIYEKIKDIPSPLVFAGDFNTWNEERMEILVEYSKKLGLSEARFFPDNRMSFNGHPLDHFLHTSDLKVTNARVDNFYMGSDHKPLLVDVEFSDRLFSKESTESDEYNQDLKD